jgi:hypothetical protein
VTSRPPRSPNVLALAVQADRDSRHDSSPAPDRQYVKRKPSSSHSPTLLGPQETQGVASRAIRQNGLGSLPPCHFGFTTNETNKCSNVETPIGQTPDPHLLLGFPAFRTYLHRSSEMVRDGPQTQDTSTDQP